jgi:hypothetical protein
MFIGHDEPTSKILGLNLGLLKKGFRCDGTGAITTTFMPDSYDRNVEGIRVRFTKTEQRQISSSRYSKYSSNNRSFFKRVTNIENTKTELTISRGVRHNGKTEISIRVTPSIEDRKKLFDIDIVSRYSRHIRTTEDITILPTIQSSADVNDDNLSPKPEEEESAKLYLDTIVTRAKEFDDSFKYIYPFLVMRNFTGISNTTLQQISLAEFDKFNRQMDIIHEVSIPSNCARKNFIEICDIFKNNNVLTKLKANNFEFRKDRNNLLVDFFGVTLINEENFKVFQYFDHPGINFCADFLDKSRTFNIVEAKISKEIITRI